ncbi:5'/3'-nucleotidase SurE [Mitsuokella sp.]
MRILIANDDSVAAYGLEALVKAFLKNGHEVIVSAPARQQSGMAHALNVGRPLELLHAKELEEKYGIEAWAVDGTPTDSVKLYLEAIAKEKPDVVVSGINHGANLATDILYSGTVGAAMEGMLHDISSFAVSMDTDSEISYDEAAEAFTKLLEQVMNGRAAAKEEKPVFWNVNFPRRYALGEDGRPQIVFGRQGKRDYHNAFKKQERTDGRVFYTVASEVFDPDKSEPTEIYAVEHGFIAVTPLMVDLTDYMMIEKLLNR